MRAVILIADDNDSLRFLTRVAIEDNDNLSGIAIEEAADGLAALDKIERLVAEDNRVLLLSDNRMPRMTGAELVEAVRARFGPRQVRIDMLTSAEPPHDFVSALAAVHASIHERPRDLNGLRKLMADLIEDWRADQPSPGAS